MFFSPCPLRDISSLSTSSPVQRQNAAALKQTVTSETIWSCVDLGSRLLHSSLPLFLNSPSLSKPQITSHSGAASASWGPAEASQPAVLLALEPELGGHVRAEAGLGFGWRLQRTLTGPGLLCLRDEPPPSTSSSSSYVHNRAIRLQLHIPVNVHTVQVRNRVCADTIPLVLLCKELISVWPRAAQPLFAPQNESRDFFPPILGDTPVWLCAWNHLRCSELKRTVREKRNLYAPLPSSKNTACLRKILTRDSSSSTSCNLASSCSSLRHTFS